MLADTGKGKGGKKGWLGGLAGHWEIGRGRPVRLTRPETPPRLQEPPLEWNRYSPGYPIDLVSGRRPGRTGQISPPRSPHSNGYAVSYMYV